MSPRKEDGEALPPRVEPHQGIGSEIAQPDAVLVVHVDRVRTGTRPGSRHSRQEPSAGSYTPTCPAFHSLTQIRPFESDHTRLAPCPAVGGCKGVAVPVVPSIRAMWLPASEA